MTTRIQVLVGTTKGLFILSSDRDRTSWQVTGPHCDGWAINHACGDPETGEIWAGGGGAFPGAGVWRFRDGTGWSLTKLADGEMDDWIRNDPDTAQALGMAPQDPAPYSGRVDSIWSVAQVGDRLFAGARPATLFVSEDRGASWQAVDSLTDHPSSGSWNPGAAGLTLHSIVTDPGVPKSMWLGISAAGVFATEDGGTSWQRRNRLSNTETCGQHDHPAAPRDGETGHCVHNMARGTDGVLYQQNHHGVYRSRDGGRSWDDITGGLPSTFGFPVAVHPGKPGTLWTCPLNGDMAGRFPPDAAAAVWRSRDGGDSWEACRHGLPQENCYFTVLRQAMATDRAAAPGLYFGTNSGSVFASTDEGDSWSEIARHLPTVLSVETMTA